MGLFPRLPSRATGRRSLREDLEALGLARGSVLVVHSSLRAVGRLEPGPEALVRALQDVVGPSGLVVMPTFTYSIASWGFGPFHAPSTPSRAGLLTETFRRMEDVHRSLHPSHSVAAWGDGARELAATDPASHTPLGAGCPLHLAALRGALVLLIGVGHERDSTIHIAECLAPAPYLDVAFTPERDHETGLSLREDGTIARSTLREVPGSPEGFPALEPELERLGLQRAGPLAGATVRMAPAMAVIETAVALLRRDPAFFLRSPAASEISRRRLERLRQLGLIGTAA
ncbi:MAG: AAC(3) family N-acetyltransferase [Candidatus Sumerlaeia bacterium]|nr:AAC(3) family N-acetyltransferase [Candidatus Sumerlaeia bacterium]